MLSGAGRVLDGEFWKLVPDDLLTLGRDLERLSRLVYAAQVHLAGEIDTQQVASSRSCSSTAALLRQAFNISAAEAIGRVKAARQMLPRESATGPELPPLLPVLGAAVDAGQLGPEHIRIVVDTMGKVPAAATTEVRQACEAALVTIGIDCDPSYLGRAATQILDRADPDGSLDKDPPAARMGLDFGSRNARTGLTPLTGHLDDLGVEAVRKAIDALAAPQLDPDRVPDSRTPSNRRAHALVAAMLGFLAAGDGPTQGGHRPHLTVVVDWDAVTGLVSGGRFDSGNYISPALARQLLCDAQIIPAIMGSQSEVLDVGRASRTFPLGIPCAITLRNRGCAWPGCDRPPAWCDVHHITFWARGLGPTSLDNGVLLCPYHHGQAHLEQWHIELGQDHLPHFIPPRWIDPDRKPQTNLLHHFTINRQ